MEARHADMAAGSFHSAVAKRNRPRAGLSADLVYRTLG